MITFLQSVVDELLRRIGWEGLHDVTLVFPMHRAGVVMRSELQARMATEHPNALWAPEIVSLGDLFDSLCPLGKEDELFTVCRLHRIYTECLKDDPMEIDRFYGWGRQLLSDFTNIDQGISESELESFFRNALSLSNLDTYKLDDDVRRRLEDLLYKGEARQQALIAESVRAHFAALWQALPDIYHRLHNELLEAGKGYEGQRMRYVVSHWQELRTRAASRTYCFIGFNYLLPIEKQLMCLLNDEGRALFFWDYVDDFHTNNKAFAFIRQNMVSLPNALPSAGWGAPKRIKTVSAVSIHSEAEYAGQWLKQTYKRKGETTAVVICDEGQLEPVIYSMPALRIGDNAQPEDINITKGFPMRNTPIFAKVMKQLDRSFAHAETPAQALQNVVDFVDEQSALSMNARQNTWQWHLGREALYQTRRTIIQFMHILEQNIVGELTAHSELLKRLIIRHLEQLTLPFHGEPITDLQIMGVLETRTLDFKHLLMLNVEEGIIPAHQPDRSFLPYYLRKAYGLQTDDERASVYAYNFFRLIRRADDVTLLFSQSQTAMTKKTMSRFIMQMLICPEEFIVDKFTLTESNTLQPVSTIQVPEDASWVDMRMAASKSLYLSPSAINTFYACKRKFYIEYMLGLSEDDEPEVIYSNRTLGLFVHESVRYLYEHHCGCNNKQAVRIHPNQIEQFNTSEHRLQALREAYERLNAEYMAKHQTTTSRYLFDLHPLENRVIDAHIEHVLARDHFDAEHRGLTILLLEYPMYTTLQISPSDTAAVNQNCQLSTTNCQLSIGGRVDRMDIVGGLNGWPEIMRIVDYKCGKYNDKKMNASSVDLRTPEKADTDYVRQTMLYSYVVYDQLQRQDSALVQLDLPQQSDAIEPHLYFTSQDLTDERVHTRVAVNKTPLVCDGSTRDQIATILHDIVGNIVREYEFAQCAQCPDYCPFLRLCARKSS